MREDEARGLKNAPPVVCRSGNGGSTWKRKGADRGHLEKGLWEIVVDEKQSKVAPFSGTAEFIFHKRHSNQKAALGLVGEAHRTYHWK